MGFDLFSSSAKNWDNTVTTTVDYTDKMFIIREAKAVNGHVIASVHYKKAKNYHGEKLLVYQNTNPKDVTSARVLDPHFDEEPGTLSPFARFEPTEEGMKAAMQVCWGLPTGNTNRGLQRGTLRFRP